jgi:hypothetical protein
VVPLELKCGLVEGATPGLGYSVTLGYAQGELRSYVEQAKASYRDVPSRSTLERMAKAIGTEAKTEAPRIEPVLRRAERLPEEARGVSLGLDRTSVPMEEDRPKDSPPKTRRKERTKAYVRKKPEPVDVNYRMAYVGTISLVDKAGEELVTRRYVARPDAEPDEVVDKLMADLRNDLRQDSSLEVGVVQDGAPELWGAVGRGLEKTVEKKWSGVIDRYHLDERLAAALQLVEPRGDERKKQLAAWNEDLDTSDRAIERIQEWLGDRIPKAEMKGDDEAGKYLAHLVYLENNHARMRYATHKRKGLPVGSGATEGSCKSVIGRRACGCGQRWRPEGVDAALTLRAIHHSDRLPAYWNQLRKCYTAEIKAAA